MKKISMFDKLMDLINVNKSKLKILNQMKEIEFKDGVDNSEYVDLVNLYEIVCKTYRNTLSQITDEEKVEIASIIMELNEFDRQNVYVDKILESDDKKANLIRIMVDIKSIKYKLYEENTRIVKSNKINTILDYLGMHNGEKEDNNENVELVNEFMLTDLLNTLMYNINEKYKNIESINDKKELLDWKYRLIFVYSIIETRHLITKFSIDNYPKLTSDVVARTAGITYEQYLDRLDFPASSLLEDLIKLKVADIYQENERNELMDEVFMKTYITLLNDKEICDNLYINIKRLPEEFNKQDIENVERINAIMLEALAKTSDIKKYRKDYLI